MNRHFRYQSPKRIPAGFALLETLIAFIVMAVGLLALFSFHSESQKNVSEAKSQSEALSLAEQKLQELESFLSNDNVDDARLLGSGGSDTKSGILVDNFQRSWTINKLVLDDDRSPPQYVSESDDINGDDACTDSQDADTGQWRRCARQADVEVTWVDRNGQPQTVAVSSAIYFAHPKDSASNFLKVVEAAEKVYGDDNAWQPGAGVEHPGGDRQIVESVATEDYAGNIPEGYAYENVFIFRIYVAGTISRYRGGSVDDVNIVETAALTIQSIDGVSNNSYVPICSSRNDRYECALYYLSTWQGWSGTINYILQTGDVFCNRSEFSNIITGNPPTGQKSYQGLEESTVFDVLVGSNEGACP